MRVLAESIAAAMLCLIPTQACASAGPDSPIGAPAVTMTTAQLFVFADQARDHGDFAVAEAAYRALSGNPDPEVRTEARFRLGMMLADHQQRYAQAATEFRRILDEKPKAARVRLELARMDALLGRPAAAARELRAAQAGGLPAAVQQAVRFYAGALEADKPTGFNLGMAIAPDTNINRATRADRLGTVIGDLTLDKNAKAQSGIGLSLHGQGFVRTPIASHARLLIQLSGQGNFYRVRDFNDVIVALQAGPEISRGRERFNLNAAGSARWYGGQPYSRSFGADGSWLHPLGPRAQVRLSGAINRDVNLRNNLQDATAFSGRLDLDRAFSAVFGAGMQISGARSAARDPGYSTASAGASGFLYREFGPVTAVVDAGYSHLEADRRLLLFPLRRIDDRYVAGVGLTLRLLRLGLVAPTISVHYERNESTVEIYRYKRLAGEIGITAAF